MRKKEVISIIIPIYNIVAYLDRCIKSVCAQTYWNLQIILVDDGSSDGSAEICDRYALDDNRIIVIHKENGGLVSARKAGLHVASGEYVSYVDGDDWIEPDMYEKLLGAMLETGADLVDSNAFMDMGGASLPIRNNIRDGLYEAETVISRALYDEDYNICSLKPYVWSKLFRKELLEKVQYLVDDSICIGEDVAVTYPYILHCKKIVIMDYAGYHYVQRQSSIINTRSKYECQKNLKLIKYLYDCFGANDKKAVLLPQLNQYAKFLFLLRHISVFDSEGDKMLIPFGGINLDEQVIVYGAGRIGQSVYQYLSRLADVHVLCWLDREYDKYRQMGLDVQAPNTVINDKYKDAKIIIAINSKSAANSVRKWLIENGISPDLIRWLTDGFVNLDFLSLVLEKM